MMAILVANDILPYRKPTTRGPPGKDDCLLARCRADVQTGRSSRDCRVGFVYKNRKFAVAVYAQSGVKLYAFSLHGLA